MRNTWFFTGQIINGALKLRNKQEWKNFCFTYEGKDVELFANPIKGKRTNQQNRLLWGAIINQISIDTGIEPEDLHAFFEDKFAERKPITLNGKTEFVKVTCSRISKGEFSMWIEKLKEFANQELGIYFE